MLSGLIFVSGQRLNSRLEFDRPASIFNQDFSHAHDLRAKELRTPWLL
jgi:hypothetical protein